MAAANAISNAVSSADPGWVGSHFVSKYYDVLASHPQFLHRFYKQGSMLSITDMQEDTSAPRTSVDLEAIQELVNDTVAGARATTKHVDAQFSINGGVLLHVAGVFVLKGVERAFDQTFFLATQENGFYVHNDLLRVYAAPAPADSNGHYAKPVPAAPTAPAPAAPIVVAAPVEPAPKPAAKAPRPQAAPAATSSPPPPQTAAAEPRAATPVRSNAPQPEQAAPPQPSPPVNTTWASLVKTQQTNLTKAPPTTPPPAPVSNAKETAPETYDHPAPQANGGSHPPSAQAPHASQEAPSQVQMHCIQVRNLPQEHLPQELLEQEFAKFGALRRGMGSVTIHNLGRESGKVAYIKYDDAAGVEAALQASVTILDKPVEIRRHDGPLPSYGRGGPGRGGFRGARTGGMPARGPYGDASGRGGGRGDRPLRTERRPSSGPGPTGGPQAQGGRTGGSGRGGRAGRRDDGAAPSHDSAGKE